MGRSSVLLVTLALLAGSGGGCHAPSEGTSLSLLDRPRPGRSRETERVAQSNPFKKPPTRPKSPAGEGVVTASHETAGEEGTPGKAPSGPDAALRLYIEEELRDATPDERAKLTRDLQNLQPELVRQILTARRMAKNLGQGTPGHSSPVITAGGSAAGALLQGGIQPAGGEQPAPVPPVSPATPPASPIRRDAGLGTDPWSQPVRPGTSSGSGGGTSFDAASAVGGPPRGSLIQPGDWDVGRAAAIAPPGVRVNQSLRIAGHSVQPGEPTAGPRVPDAANLHTPPLPEVAGTAKTGLIPSNSFPPLAPGVEPTASLGPATTTPPTTTAAMPVRLGSPDRLPPDGDLPPSPGNAPPRERSSKWDEELQRVIGLTETQVGQLKLGEQAGDAQRRNYIEQHVYLRMLYLMAGQQERALTAIPGIDAADQEFWQQTFWAVANYFDAEAIPDRSDRATQTVAQLRQAVRRLQETARLDLRNVTFCHKISSFGDYERFERDEFSPGQPVLLYAEVSNFRSEPTVDGQFRTILRSHLEIYKAGPAGDLVEKMDFGTTEDLCRNYRRDYFHSYEFTMPQKLSLGPHVLKLTIEDQLGQKVATYKLNFLVK